MLELTGIASLLRGISVLYWLLAMASFALVAWKVKRWPYKLLGLAVVLILFSYSPFIDWQEQQKRETYAREAWAYFKKKCDTEAGEKIHKTFAGVKSVLVTKPLPPASEKDLFDQFWYGDPYSSASTEGRARDAAYSLMAARAIKKSEQKVKGFDFVEQLEAVGATSDRRYIRFSLPDPRKWMLREEITKPVSRFGISWEDVSTPEDRKYWVAGSRLRVIDLHDDSIVAERIGFFIEAGFGSKAGHRRPWLTSRGPNTTCPKIEHSFDEDSFFVQRAISPIGGSDGK